VFADIDRATFNIDPACVEKLITPRTKAVIAVDIFGQSADMVWLRDICNRHGLKLLNDCAQAPGARHHGVLASTMADIGGYSLNYHKHIHCGEGGVLVTNDDRYARRLAQIRNHAECVQTSDDPSELASMLGYNFRLGEIEAAIASVQLTRLAARVEERQQAAALLNKTLGKLPGLTPPAVLPGNTHAYYIYALQIDTARLGLSRARLVDALKAEGVPGLVGGYQNLHLLPLFRQRIAYGTQGFPWKGAPQGDSTVFYGPGLCPVAEDLHSRSFLGLAMGQFALDATSLQAVITAFHKVWANLDALRDPMASAA
jgi:dTDP-4-amino-4,6-dideoxygalactose transaminase